MHSYILWFIQGGSIEQNADLTESSGAESEVKQSKSLLIYEMYA